MASPAGAASHVYVTAWDAGRVDEFAAHPNGTLFSIGTAPANRFQPWYMAMTSNAKNLYLTAYTTHSLESFSVSADSRLQYKSAAHGGELTTGTQPEGIAVSPDNKSAYVANKGAGSVSIYDIAADGSIKVHSPDSVPAGNGPAGVAVARNGRSVYVASQDGNIYEFNRATNGSLTAKSPAMVTVKQLSDSPTPDWVVLTPDGKHLYSANYNDSSVGIFDVGLNGRLTEKSAGSPVAGGYGFYEIAMSPNGKSLYGTDSIDGKVWQYSVLSDGSLHSKSPASVLAGVSLDGIWPSPDGKSAYVANAGTYGGGTYHDGSVSQFTLDAGGRLLAKSPPTVATENYPAAIVTAPDQSPAASFTFSHKKGLTKKFNGTGSKDPDGTISRYAWSFGDGAVLSAGGAKQSHKYTHAGTYNVRLTVFDNSGCSIGQVWTGQTAYCGGSPAATLVHKVTVKKPKHKKHKH